MVRDMFGQWLQAHNLVAIQKNLGNYYQIKVMSSAFKALRTHSETEKDAREKRIQFANVFTENPVLARPLQRLGNFEVW